MLLLPEAVSDLFHLGTAHQSHKDIERDAETRFSNSFARQRHAGGVPRHTFLHHLHHHHHPHRPHFTHASDEGEETHTYRILPIFSGIMIPFSIMLSIPSLTGHWYIHTGAHGRLVETRRNPPLLDIAMGFSMACGVLASACLVIRFAERKIKFMTMMCIVFLTLHDLINIPAVTIFGVQHGFDDGFTYGQSFWFTVFSTMASTATNITLITDYHKTKDFSHAGSGLTQKQRSLVIITIVLLCYVSLGSLILAIMLHVTFIDALYLSVVSIETIGFGDLHPPSAGARVFMCFYICGGILNLALAVALSRDALLESAAIGFRARLRAAEIRQREKHIRDNWRAAVRWRVRAKGHPLWIDDREEERRQRVGLGRRRHWYSKILSVWRRLCDEVWREWEDPAWKYVYGKRHRRLNLEVLTLAELETAALEAGAPLSELVPKGIKLRPQKTNNGGSDAYTSPNSHFPSFETKSSAVSSHSLTNVRMGGMVSLIGKFAFAVTHGVHHAHDHDSQQSADEYNLEESHYREDDDDEDVSVSRVGRLPFIRSKSASRPSPVNELSLAESLRKERRNAFRARLSIALALFVIFWMVGSAVFMQTEHWDFGTAAYFCFISFTTVGYGDFSPQTPAGRSIFVVWALLGVGTMTILISILAEAYSNQYKSVINSGNLRPSDIAEPKETEPNQNTGETNTIYGSANPGKNMEDELTSNIIFSAPGSSPSTSTLASTCTSSRYGRSRRPSMSPIPEVEHTIMSRSLSRRRGISTDKDKIKTLSLQALRNVDTLRSILTSTAVAEVQEMTVDLSGNSPWYASSLRMEQVLVQMDRSLRDISNVANDSLNHDSP
ncbi:hypothetical protein D9613_008731 [Agrocybe pediades]|uniref:Potassium channel domain-containing protein n=1 Tax=Agrocybe pediades TaxID=84607 RepID=A0A8H4QTS3_9AGAR|nr:hypothetical protein D9613_008731 [Agrocybe pediades]